LHLQIALRARQPLDGVAIACGLDDPRAEPFLVALLTALKAHEPAEADTLARRAVASFADHVRDPTAFRQIERDLLQALARHESAPSAVR
jgi:hypothetical protein